MQYQVPHFTKVYKRYEAKKLAKIGQCPPQEAEIRHSKILQSLLKPYIRDSQNQYLRHIKDKINQFRDQLDVDPAD